MNLDDYSYELEGRRYLNPQVSLDEQNAFIDNLRNIQAQNNAEITQQTYGLGTQIASNLGGLSGGSGYFRARYQTPQTNQGVAGLRAAAQAQAMNAALNNQIAQAEKRYKDAYHSANERGTNANNPSDSSGLFDKVAASKLKVNTTTNPPEEIVLSQDTMAGQPNRVWIDESTGTQVWTDDDGMDWEMLEIPMGNLPSIVGGDLARKPQNGEIRTYNGATYLYLDNDQYNGRWFLLGGRMFR